MISNNEIYIQYQITKKIRLFFILSSIRKNIESYDKKENKKKDTTSYRNEINIKKRRSKKPRIKILKEIINISER